MKNNNIHETAIVSPTVQLGENITIGAYAVIKDNVTIGDNTRIQEFVSLENSTIGNNCLIGTSSVIGGEPQDISYNQEPTEVIIGNNVKIRDYVTVNRGTVKDQGKTIIKDNCYLMTSAHVGHDCIIEESVILGNNIALGGHVHIEQNVNMSAFCAAQQNITIGELAFCGAQVGILSCVPPFVMIEQRRAKIFRVNNTGMERNGYNKDEIYKTKWAYNTLKRHTKKEALDIIQQEADSDTNIARPLLKIINFYKTHKTVVSFMAKGEDS